MSPTGAVVVVCPGYTCADPMMATRVNSLSGVALVPALAPGLYNWRVETASGMRLSPDRVFAVRALSRPTDEDAVALGTTLWIDQRDGDSDWAIGAPGTAPSGAVTVATSLRGRVNLQPPMGAVGFGSALANAGELRGDGRIAMAVSSDADPSRESTVSLFESDGTTLRPAPSVVLSGAVGDRFGAAIAGGGDVDGDGFADLVISAPGARGGRGEVRIQYGARALAAPASETFEGALLLGERLVSGCDFDGDGFADYAASSSTTRGFVVVRFGGPRTAPATMVRIDPDPMFSASAFGQSMACGGDFNGDGRSDLVIGDTAARVGAGRASYVVIVSFSAGRSATRTVRQPVNEIPGFASAVVIVRDINSDQRDDVIVTATNKVVAIHNLSTTELSLPVGTATAMSAGLSETSTALAPAILVGSPSQSSVSRLNETGGGFGAITDNGAAGSRYGAAVLQ
jgi:microcompartment protein CcmK/EutM